MVCADKIGKRDLERQIDSAQFERSKIKAKLSPMVREWACLKNNCSTALRLWFCGVIMFLLYSTPLRSWENIYFWNRISGFLVLKSIVTLIQPRRGCCLPVKAIYCYLTPSESLNIHFLNRKPVFLVLKSIEKRVQPLCGCIFYWDKFLLMYDPAGVKWKYLLHKSKIVNFNQRRPTTPTCPP